MATAEIWLENRLKAVRLEYGAEDAEKIQMEEDFYLMELACAIGRHLNGARYSVFHMVLTGFTTSYAGPAAGVAPTSAARPDFTTILTPAELEGAELRANRLRRGMTQFQIGDGVGVTNSTISLWERAEAKMTDNDRQKLARFFADNPVQLKIKGFP